MSNRDNVFLFPSSKRAAQGAPEAENPFLGSGLFESMKACEAKQRAASIELLAVEALGAGKHGINPFKAPSWAPLMPVKRRGCTLREVLVSVASTGRGYDALRAWGIDCLHWQHTQIDLGVNLGSDSKAGPLYAKFLVPEWRKALAYDCSRLVLDRPKSQLLGFDHFVGAWACFALPVRRGAD